MSLGSVDSLAEHPCTMTHCEAGKEANAAKGITESLIRMSIGVEHPDDLVADVGRAGSGVRASVGEVGSPSGPLSKVDRSGSPL